MKKLIPFLFILAFACNKEDDPDLRDQAVGTYNYTIKYYYVENGDQNYFGSDTDERGTMILEKDTNPKSITFSEGGDLVFQGTNLVTHADGFAFNIATQTVTESGVTYTFRGYKIYDQLGVLYDGAYYTNTKKVSFAFTFDNANDVQIIAKVDLIKAN